MGSPPDHPSEQFRARVILLGASNVTKGISTIIEIAQSLLGGPIDVYAAIGHGRSYGIRSRVIIRDLPSILESRLWDVVSRQPQQPTFALIGDIGNDVMYGPSPSNIAGWVETCLNRLGHMHATTVCTNLPLERIERLQRWQFLVARTILFPTHRLTFEDAIRRAYEVSQRVEAITSAQSVPFISLPAAWYGIDPIHIRRPFWAEAWGAILHHWVKGPLPAATQPKANGSFSRWLKIRSKSPERWWLLGMRRGRSQPCVILRDGTRVSLY